MVKTIKKYAILRKKTKGAKWKSIANFFSKETAKNIANQHRRLGYIVKMNTYTIQGYRVSKKFRKQHY
jgi:hypothetical protein